MSPLLLSLIFSCPEQGELQAIVDQAVSGTRLPGMTAAVAFADGRVIEVAGGWADRDARVKMKVGDRILAGSIGKTWTAAYALRLVEQKKLDLDTRVSTYLKDTKWYHRIPNAATITVRHLMQHTSGIPEHVESDEFSKAIVASPDKVWSAEDILAYSLDKKPLFEAGQGWSYADTNFCLLGAVIEAITKRPLFEGIKSEILTKVKLRLTEPQKGRLIKGLVQGYTVVNGLFGLKGAVLKEGRLPFDPQMEYGGGGMVTTSGDLARWAVALYSGKVIAPSSVETMTTGVPARTGPGEKYGLGCQIRPSAFGETWGHNGWFPGWLSDVQYFPKQKIAIAVQFNTDDQRASGRSFRALIGDVAKVFVGAQSQ